MMKWLDVSLASPAENLALDEALLDAAEAATLGPCLRFWESPQPFVVLGYANRIATESNRAACGRLRVPVLRRCSGGGTVVQGPGVLNYALVLPVDVNAALASISGANRFIMERNAAALGQLVAQPVEVQGHTDLAIQGFKFSGNAQRRKRTHLLFHGAILLGLDIDLLEQVLPLPSLQPDYRHARSHRDFLRPLMATADGVKTALRTAWSAHAALDLGSDWPAWHERVQALVAEKYSRAEWNERI